MVGERILLRRPRLGNAKVDRSPREGAHSRCVPDVRQFAGCRNLHGVLLRDEEVLHKGEEAVIQKMDETEAVGVSQCRVFHKSLTEIVHVRRIRCPHGLEQRQCRTLLRRLKQEVGVQPRRTKQERPRTCSLSLRTFSAGEGSQRLLRKAIDKRTVNAGEIDAMKNHGSECRDCAKREDEQRPDAHCCHVSRDPPAIQFLEPVRVVREELHAPADE